MKSSQAESVGDKNGPPRKGGRRKRGQSQGDGPRSAMAQSTLSDTMKRFIALDDPRSEKCELCGESSCVAGMIQCEICENHHHLKCCNIDTTYQEIARGLLHLAGWTCRDCRMSNINKQVSMERAIMDLSRQVDELKAANAARLTAELKASEELKASNAKRLAAEQKKQVVGASTAHPAEASEPHQGEPHQRNPPVAMSRTQVASLIAKSMTDKDRRRRNIIVSGIPEFSTAEGDARAFVSICEQNLSTKPIISAQGTKRLGKVPEGRARPRRLLVHLESEIAATAILQSARQLRAAEDPFVSGNIFINPDLTIEEQKAAFNRRTQRRVRLSAVAPTNVQADPTNRSTPMQVTTQPPCTSTSQAGFCPGSSQFTSQDFPQLIPNDNALRHSHNQPQIWPGQPLSQPAHNSTIPPQYVSSPNAPIYIYASSPHQGTHLNPHVNNTAINGSIHGYAQNQHAFPPPIGYVPAMANHIQNYISPATSTVSSHHLSFDHRNISGISNTTSAHAISQPQQSASAQTASQPYFLPIPFLADPATSTTCLPAP